MTNRDNVLKTRRVGEWVVQNNRMADADVLVLQGRRIMREYNHSAWGICIASSNITRRNKQKNEARIKEHLIWHVFIVTEHFIYLAQRVVALFGNLAKDGVVAIERVSTFG